MSGMTGNTVVYSIAFALKLAFCVACLPVAAYGASGPDEEGPEVCLLKHAQDKSAFDRCVETMHWRSCAGRYDSDLEACLARVVTAWQAIGDSLHERWLEVRRQRIGVPPVTNSIASGSIIEAANAECAVYHVHRQDIARCVASAMAWRAATLHRSLHRQ